MSTAIQWTDETWNPVTGCTKVSPGCANCYIEKTPAFRMTGQRFERGRIPVRLHHDRLDQPLHWRKPRRVFVVSMGDLFHEDVPDQFIGDVFKVMDEAPHHTFQVLTKRPDRMRRVIQKLTTWHEHHIGGFSVQDWPLPNVWLGVSVENQWATWRVEELMKTPAAVRFISGEPLLGPLDLTPWLWGACSEHDGPGLSCNHYQCASARRIDWVIVGGESGPGRAERKLVERCVCKGQKEGHAESWVRVGKDDRGLPLYGGWHPKRGPEAWVLDLRNQCQAAGVPFFFKQWGGPRPTSGGRLLDGREWNEMPVGEP